MNKVIGIIQYSGEMPRLGRSVTATGKTTGVVYAMHKALDFYYL